jgi:NADPH-dependent 7-cyano-7-deazaguanine reductase QueF
MILDKLISECKPRKAEVTGIFRPRGGIAIHVTATFGGKI